MREVKKKGRQEPRRMKKKRERKEKKREEEKEENEKETVKRKCEGLVSVEAFEIISQGRDLESFGDLSWNDPLEKPEDLSDCEPVSSARVRVVPDATVSPSSVVTEFCDVSLCCSDREFVEPQSFSFSRKRALCCASTQEEMRYEGSQGKAPPKTRRRMLPPAPLQNSPTSFEREQESHKGEGRGWCVKVRVEEVEGLSGPEDVDQDSGES